tara:strand:- start:828 stop:953 length:126 start_codon:yes stop_codon:yes gene_type:complete
MGEIKHIVICPHCEKDIFLKDMKVARVSSATATEIIIEVSK